MSLVLLNLLTKNLRFIAFNAPISVSRLAQCFYSAKEPIQKVVKEVDPNTGEIKRKKTSIIPKITLLTGENNISITTLTEAENLSKRRGLKLVKITDLDTKSQRPVYKLMTGAEYHAEDLRQREERKNARQNVFIRGEKVVFISSKISPHDLDTYFRKASKWIEKSFEVRVVINGTPDSSEKIYSGFEEHFKTRVIGSKIVQKRLTGGELKFQILPPKKTQSTSYEISDSSSRHSDDGSGGHGKKPL